MASVYVPAGETFVHPNGLTYRAVRALPADGSFDLCRGCEFGCEGDRKECFAAPDCGSNGPDVIFVLADPQPLA